jgi:hypothetical protein
MSQVVTDFRRLGDGEVEVREVVGVRVRLMLGGGVDGERRENEVRSGSKGECDGEE